MGRLPGAPAGAVQLVHRLLGKERGERAAGVAVQLSRMSKEVRR